MYKLIRPILFKFNPEFIHKMTMKVLHFLEPLSFLRGINRFFFRKDHPALEREYFGLKFRNPIGLAAGMDKNGEVYNMMSDLGFGFVEIGSLTPKPQHGNPKPRLFRLTQDKALLSRMGLNNKGVRHAIENLRTRRPEIIVAANIARNSSSNEEQVPKDYDTAFSLLYDLVDMFVVNISFPTAGRPTDLQDVSFLSEIMDGLLDRRATMEEHKPVFIKLSPDIPDIQLDAILDYALRNGVEGIVAGNATSSREGLSTSEERLNSLGKGGICGAPLYEKSLRMVRYIHDKTRGKLPIIGCGGISNAAQAREMLDAGASLIEVYTGFIYEGPGFVERLLKGLDPPKEKKEKKKGKKSPEPALPPAEEPLPQDNTATQENA
ncbi:MAG: quinone-dependent dihydroorotate dehydrogenase [Bacteroidales bacterium]|nr:quinone-dependent dihydroorotate dehydrogenase [Bacteroidales bacterium]